jgi:hypothetical protein
MAEELAESPLLRLVWNAAILDATVGVLVDHQADRELVRLVKEHAAAILDATDELLTEPAK